jgi:predicted nucleic acid-binding protein
MIYSTQAMRRLYLDLCCLNRPFDDQNQERVHLEAEAVLESVEAKANVLISSDALLEEIANNPDTGRQRKLRDMLGVASYHIRVTKREADRAESLQLAGFGGYDALHVACAEKGRADVLLTTDEGLIRKARRYRRTELKVFNPLQWVVEGRL